MSASPNSRMTDFDNEAVHWTVEENDYYDDQNGASSSQFDPFQNMDKVAHPEPEEPVFKAEPMTIRVDDPQKSSSGSFMTYRLFTMTALENYSTNNRPVRRRFSDFVWLHNALSIEFPACIIPPLPEKHRLKFFKGNRFDPLFIEQRRLGLQWFMDRIARHPYLQASQYTRLFLESTDFVLHVKKPDEKFEEMKESIEKFQVNLQVIERLYSKIGKRQQELETNYSQFAISIRGLSGLETNVDQQLRQFAESVENYANAFKERRRQEELLFLNDLHELLNYCHAVKEQLIERDKKQITFEDMSTDLQSIVLERERALYPGKNLGSTSGMNITEFMTDKMTDMGKARSEKLGLCVAKANDENNNYSTQMMKEFDLFKQAKEIELKQSLSAYADSHIEFYKKSISIWENILPVLNGIQLHDI
ncbi:hypothetical protein RO3G_05763 [Rhizopus delemar RA 99-880]|uniref:Sorting nexin-4 n=1 Tax=Rhizopus delemar (strain RA 99-880 / ATCC MYA-4621 / FGSC 9543 / NRRL 43880) TaxID=246409 RepID=I1BXX8_RHIO9|nr:hypothetical protein RO3G_05763 [Rhizopus delemar RA 99-880]|eukprot:EIE81058.1 hypothetical protein RO3G_05763 [Rhizopus delemar RA 99-880]